MTEKLEAKLEEIVDLLVGGNTIGEALILLHSASMGFFKAAISQNEKPDVAKAKIIGIINSMRESIEDYQPPKKQDNV